MKLKNLGIVILLLWSVTSVPLYAQSQNSIAGDLQALVDLYNATNGSNWKNSTGWLQGNPSDSWFGVEVDANGRVIKVDLSDNNLRGTNGLPNSIGNLKNMTYFNVMFNSIEGNLPESLFSQCTRLVYLYLNFSDDVLGRNDDPHEKALGLAGGGLDVHTGKQPRASGGSDPWNTFTGEIPSTTNLPNLEWFALSWVKITNVDNAIFNSTKLKGLWLAQNEDMGGVKKQIPSTIGQLRDLEQLALNQQQVGNSGEDAWGGEIPAEFSNLTKLKSLRLDNNNFTGTFPDLSGATKMQTFTISFNEFADGFPTYGLDGTWEEINSFIVSFTKFNDAYLPKDAPYTLRTLNVPETGISGSLPTDTFVDQIIVTDFSYNNLSGETPSDLRNLKRIRNLRWSENDLSGQWPDLDWTNKQNLTNSAGTVIHPLRDFTRAHFDNNRYVFADMLVVSDNGKTLFEWYQQEADVSFRYGDQKKFGSYGNKNGDIIDFSSIVTHSDNKYTWYRNGNRISGESSSVINTSDHGSGIYKLEVTNPNVSGLTLESIDIDTDGSGDTSNPPNAPSLNSPQNGAANLSTTLTLDWNASTAADDYQLQVATDASFSSTFFDRSGITDSSREVAGMNNTTTYYWRVRASNRYGVSSWSTVRNFTTGSGSSPGVIPAPVLEYPKDNADSTSIVPTFEWDPVSGADYYELHSNRVNPGEMVIETQVGESYFIPVEDTLSPETTHHWRVRAVKDGVEGEWSPVWEFTTRDTTGSTTSPPAIPVLDSPQDGASEQSMALTLDWSQSNGADSYQLQLATDQGFSSMTLDSSDIAASFLEQSNLNNATIYYWRVRASNEAGNSNWSEVRSFTTVNQAPSAPSLVSPADESSDVTVNPFMEWNAVNGADTYRLQISTGEDFTNVIRNVEDLTSTSQRISELPDSTSYYWRVRAVEAGVEGTWSSTWTFTTGSNTNSSDDIPDTPSPNYPVVNAANVSLTPTFRWGSVDADHYMLEVTDESSGAVIDVQVQGSTFTVTEALTAETVYSWRVRAVKNGVQGEWSSKRKFTTGVGEGMKTTLTQNYPNPFNPSTQIRFSLAETQDVSLKVYDTVGRLVATLVEETLTAGSYERTFQANNLASGVYFIRLITNNRVLNSQMTLMK